MATMYIKFTHDEIQKELPYALIGETYVRAIWDTGKRKRLMSNMFTESERVAVLRICKQARIWLLVSGVPVDGVMMTLGTRKLWDRVAEFCMML